MNIQTYFNRSFSLTFSRIYEISIINRIRINKFMYRNLHNSLSIFIILKLFSFLFLLFLIISLLLFFLTFLILFIHLFLKLIFLILNISIQFRSLPFTPLPSFSFTLLLSLLLLTFTRFPRYPNS